MANYTATSTLLGTLGWACDEANSTDYWNIDDILAEEESVPCTFKIDAKGLGYLDQLEAL